MSISNVIYLCVECGKSTRLKDCVGVVSGKMCLECYQEKTNEIIEQMCIEELRDDGINSILNDRILRELE